MIIAPATVEDAPAILEIVNAVIEGSTATFTTVLKTESNIIADIQSDWPFLVVKDGADVIGYARYFPFRSGPGYAHVAEYSIALTQSAQGKGTGAMLLAALCDLATRNGISQLIGAVSSSNDAAIKFHSINGFTQVGCIPEAGRKWGQSLDLILMQKRL